ncbi:Kinesin-like protein KIF2A [Auxenochlorella protothecoides]|uniref:Kinesin-like protein n=1 Tax=Auxenochlorella protothecoides TaxID=3075 RepID=A0A087SAQ9_AUXPR|nr:Kinesin-like protein KIF2A [Auxenochlorella protothecoides]KFM22813.1 Kinesin-like protein KIF2A [Auxenochlorella protothecoides]
MAPDPPKIRVIVRKRPLNRKEEERGDSDVLECDCATSTLYVNEPKQKVDLTKFTERHTFRFDDVFGEDVDNDALYCTAIQPLISTIFRRGKATCFAYGQTGSGKTYTMQPLPLRAAVDVLSVLSTPDFHGVGLHVSCYEIYGGKLFDLLNARNKLEVREDGKRRVQVVGLREVDVHDVDVLQQLVEHAAASRSTGSTGANDESSRSHSIMVFALRNGNEPKRPVVGKLTFIDLAGSERGADTYDNDKQTRLEGAEINKSLLALKECIRALDSDARHIPFRGSKLTEVLRDSFMGKAARTVMIANVSPSLLLLRAHAEHPALRRSSQGTAPAADAALDAELSALMAAEDELVAAHRQHIEDSMAHVREEMALLGDLDGGGAAGDVEAYAAELTGLLAEKAAAVAALQLRVTQFRRLVQTTLERHARAGSGAGQQ